MKKFSKPSKISNHFVIYDLETGSADPYTCQPIELSAVVVDCNTLEQKDVVFNQLILPDDWDGIQEEALKVNKITKEELLEKGVEQEVVFREFIKYCRQYQKSDNVWEGLIPVGYNIVGFDNIIMSRLCFKYGHVDKGRPRLFHPMHRFDVMDIMRLWFNGNDELPSYSMDNLREYFGIESDNAHRAMTDVQDTYLIFRRFMEFHRKLSVNYISKFKGCFE